MHVTDRSPNSHDFSSGNRTTGCTSGLSTCRGGVIGESLSTALAPELFDAGFARKLPIGNREYGVYLGSVGLCAVHDRRFLGTL